MCLDKPLKEVISQITVDGTHGTSCAGIVGMIANNDKCGVGVAYNASIAGKRCN